MRKIFILCKANACAGALSRYAAADRMLAFWNCLEKGMSLSMVVVLVVLFLVAVYGVILYNGLVRLKHGVGKAWANIDVLLRQRHEELPKLVETCRQYMQTSATRWSR